MESRYGISMLLVCACLAFAAAGCGTSEGDEMLQLSWREFDQSPDTGWRPIADLHFHAAVLWAFEEREERATGHLGVARVGSFPEGFPQSWNALVSGTLGFIERDMDAVRTSIADIKAMPALTVRDSMFLQGLEELATKEGMSCAEATAEWRE